MLVRVHLPATYALTLAAMTFVAAGWLTAIFGALAGRSEAWEILLAAIVLAMLRTTGRAFFIARLWGRAGLRENQAFLLADPFLAPLVVMLSAAFGWSAIFLRRTTWAGITYEILGPQRVKVLARRTVE